MSTGCLLETVKMYLWEERTGQVFKQAIVQNNIIVVLYITIIFSSCSLEFSSIKS